jgi:hypothetical protein
LDPRDVSVPADPLFAPQDFQINQSERARNLEASDLFLRPHGTGIPFSEGNLIGDCDWHIPHMITLREWQFILGRARSQEAIAARRLKGTIDYQEQKVTEEWEKLYRLEATQQFPIVAPYSHVSIGTPVHLKSRAQAEEAQAAVFLDEEMPPSFSRPAGLEGYERVDDSSDEDVVMPAHSGSSASAGC